MNGKKKSKKPVGTDKWPEPRDYDRRRRFCPSATEEVEMGLVSITSERPGPPGEKAPPPERRA